VYVDKSDDIHACLGPSDLVGIPVKPGSIDEGEVIYPWEALVDFGYEPHIHAWNMARG